MDEAEKAALAVSYGGEPETPADEKVEANVDGTVTSKEEVPVEKSIEEMDASELLEHYKKLQSENERLSTFASQVLTYTEKDPDDETNIRWDMKRVAESQGYTIQENTLVKTTEVPMGNEVTTPAKTEASSGISEEEVKEFNKNPKNFLEKFSENLLSRVAGIVEEKTKPIIESHQRREAKTALGEIRAKYPDLDQYSKTMSRLVTKDKMPINTPEQIEAVYFAARGIDGASGAPKTPNLATSTGGSSGAGSGTQRDFNDEIGDAILNAGVKPKGADLNTLFGKSTISPMEGVSD